MTKNKIKNNGLKKMYGLYNGAMGKAFYVETKNDLINLKVDIELLSCDYLFLTELPDLKHLANLKVLYCSNNELKTLPELPPNLKVLDCGNNKLSYLPVLPSSLIELKCNDNELKEMTDLSQCINLELINIDNNNELTEIPDLTQCKKLKEIYCSSCNKFKEEVYEIIYNDCLTLQEMILQLDEKQLFQYNNNFILK